MPCPTCGHTMTNLGLSGAGRAWHCPRCGTLKSEGVGGAESVTEPALARRVRELRDVMAERVGFGAWDRQAWREIGLFEAAWRPGERPA